MSESKSSEWTAAWIEQQRELLRKQAASAAPDLKQAQAGLTQEVRELGEKWRALGQSWLSGLAQHSQQTAQQPGAAPGVDEGVDEGIGAGAGEPFKIGEELLNVWRSAWTTAHDMKQGAASSISDLLARLPPIGLAREHTEAWRDLAAAQVECQRLEQELRTVLMGVQGDALNLLEQRVRERDSKGEQLADYRDLYDLWVDCAEQVYATVAHSGTYCKLQAELGNASMRLRSHQQKVIEHGLKQFDLPTRSELNTVHRQLREQKQRIANLELKLRQATPGRKPSPATAGKTAPQPVRGAKKSRTSKTVASKPSARKNVARKKGRSR